MNVRAWSRVLHFQELGVLLALLAMCAALTFSTDTFLTQGNLLKVARQSSYAGIMAVGMVFVLVMGDVDLSVGSIFTLSNLMMAVFLRMGWPIPAALLGGLGTGAVCGFLNGALSVALRIPMIIITLGTLSVYKGLALVVSKATPITPTTEQRASSFFTVGGGELFGKIPTSVVVMVVMAGIGWLALTRTRWGRHVKAIGANPTAAFLAGLPINRYRIGVMTVNGLIAALGGVCALAFLTSADPLAGDGYELRVIASVIIGGTALSGGQGTIIGAILGALIIAVIQNGLVLRQVSPYASTAVTGGVIILAVAVDSFVKRRTKAA